MPARADRALPESAGNCPVWKAKTIPNRQERRDNTGENIDC